MNKITGRIVVHETDRPISSLQVHFYSLKEKSLPKSIRDEPQWDKLYEAGWKGLTTTRLGSVQTTAEGLIDYEYDPSLVKLPPNTRDLNLWFAVVGPEITGAKGCPKVLHVGCDVRVNAGIHESYVVRIPSERLIRLGLNGGTAKLSESFSTPELYTLLDKVTGTSLLPDPPALRGSFGEHFRKRQKEHNAMLKKEGLSLPTKSAFPVSLPLRSSAGKAISRNTKIQFDKNEKTFTVKRGNEEAKPLKFDGVVRLEATNLKSLKQNRFSIQIDDKTGNFKLALLNVPDALRLTDNEPDKLYEHHRKNNPA